MYKFLENSKILSVEDNPDIQKYNECSLVKLNVNLFLASDGMEAIEILKREPIDIILMDLYMPNMNGIRCIKMIRNELNLYTPIIVLTAGLIDLHSEIYPMINGFLLKPYKYTELLNLIEKNLKVEVE